MLRPRGGSGFALGIVAGFLAVQVVAAVTVAPLSFAAISGAEFGVTGDDRLVYDDWNLVFDTTGEVTAVGVGLNNTEGVDKTGRITVRLEQKDGTVVAADNRTFFVQKNRAGRCSVTLPSSHPPGSFSFVVLDVNVTSVATQDCEIKGGGGGGNNTPPTADIETDPRNPKVGDTVAFEGNKSDSGDKDDSIVSFEWEIEVENGSTINRTGEVVTRTYTQAGCYNATLTVTDSAGATDTTSEVVKVKPQQGNIQC